MEQKQGERRFSLGERHPESVEGACDAFVEPNQDRHNWLMLEGKPFSERYMEGATNISLLLKRSGRAPNRPRWRRVGDTHDFLLVFEADKRRAPHHLKRGGAGVEIPDGQIFEHGGRDRRDQKPMFVGDIEHMETEKIVVPSRVRLQIADCLDDLWAGELHLSAYNHL